MMDLVWLFIVINFWIAVAWIVFGTITWLADKWEDR